MTILVDMDGVLCTEEKTFERALAQPMPGARETLEALVEQGHTIVIYSARSWSELRMTEAWLREHRIPFHGVHLGKPVADRIIDDRSISFVEWGSVSATLNASTSKYTGGPVDEGLLTIIRRRIKSFLVQTAERSDLMGPVLEVGPMVHSGLASPVYQRMPDVFVDSPSLFRGRGHEYIGLDLDPSSKPDVVGDFMDAEKLFQPGSIGSIVILGTMEHMPRIFDVPRIMHRILKPEGRVFALTPWNLRFHGPRPDCWRISDDGYRALFGDLFHIDELDPIPCPGRPLSPVGFTAVLRKR